MSRAASVARSVGAAWRELGSGLDNDAMVEYNDQFLAVMPRNGLTPPDWMTEMGQAMQALQP